LSKDELNRELAAKRALFGFTALQPAFNPTFKVRLHQLQHGIFLAMWLMAVLCAEEAPSSYLGYNCGKSGAIF
jgi:hypothetical protein